MAEQKHKNPKRQRQALRMSCTKEIEKNVTIENLDGPEDVIIVQVAITKLNDYRNRLLTFNSDILDQIESDDDAAADAAAASEYDDNILSLVATLSARLQEYINAAANSERASSTLNLSNQSFRDHKASVQLPKLQITKFNGDPLKWQEFWDSYTSTVHENPSLSQIDKYKYLRSFLVGDALRFVEGYRLTADNYDTVVEALSERFGNEDIAVHSHLEALLALPVASHETNQLQHTYDECERHIRSLIALGLAEDTFGRVFTPIILSKLPTYVRMELHRKNGSLSWTLKNLREMLKEEIRARDMSQRSFGGVKTTHEKQNRRRDNDRHDRYQQQKHRPSPGSSSSLLANDAPREPHCSLCSEKHYTDLCKKFPDLTSRLQRLKGRCSVCLSTRHENTNCPARQNVCFHCQKDGHHRALCPTKFGTNNSRSYQRKSGTTTHHSTSSSAQLLVDKAKPVNSTLLSHGEQVMLQTALTKIQNTIGGNPLPARLLFDTGCSRTFITTKMAKQIGAQPSGEEVISIAGFADSKRKTIAYKIVTFDVVLSNGSTKTVTANVTPNISCPIQKLPVDVHKYPVIQTLILAEPMVTKTQMVGLDVLIGSDYYYDFIGTHRIQCTDGLIFLSSSLGFIVTGRVEASSDTRVASSMIMYGNSDFENNYDLTLRVDRYWSLEDIGVNPPTTTNDDEEALQSFNNTVRRENGRYAVTWPWKSDAPELPEHFQLAYGRLKSLVKRLSADKELFARYDETIQDQLTKGVIEIAPKIPTSDNVHYIPHHCVVTPNKATTKLRIVYDASAKLNKTSPSLNESLHRGPVLLDDLCGLLMRFRLQAVGIVSDIEKAFLQVALQEESRDVTRFLWVKNPQLPPTGDNLVVFRFARVPFGFIPSPFLLGAVIHHHVKQSNSPVASDVVGNMYVDNVVTGKHTVDEAKLFYNEAKVLFEDASMNLREWYSNSEELLSTVKEKDRGQGTETKVLGLKWNTQHDTLSCSSFPATPNTINTKRLMLKQLAKVFDPCGYFSAVTVAGKLMIQKLWQNKYGWDDPLPVELIEEWKQCSENLQQIAHHKIDRCLNKYSGQDAVSYQLHCFCDASAKAYAAIIYLKVTTTEMSSVDLIFAKSRVSPVKSMSIPRLELMAALIGTRLLIFVEKQLRVPIDKKFVWSDSKCVLYWLVKKTISTVFVKNRVSEITSHDDVVFRYVPTGLNPADLSSRGCTYSAVVDNQLWWKGPSFLTKSVDEWPEDIEKSELPQEESHSDSGIPESALVQIEHETVIDAANYSSLTRLLRVTCWMFRFINNSRKTKVRVGTISVDEMADAQTLWDKNTQKACFSGLLVENPDKSVASKFSQLDLFVDDNGLLRCGGRFQNADIPDNAKCPILLPKNNSFTDLIILDCHRKLFHSGVAHTLSQIRNKYWVIHGRGQVKKIINSCMICRASHGGPFRVPAYPPLPDFRVTQHKPFSRVGIDYLGPLYIKSKNGGDTTKVWICLYTCAVVRAIHLEVVDELSTEQFLLCFRRFISLYGKPDMIVSDNAKQFHTANTTLRKIWADVETHDDVQNYSTACGIKWKFITELAPWMGGFYERMVGVVKRCLKKVLDKRCVGVVELQTIAAEIAAIINSRPLVYSEALPSESPITPAHFLGGPHSLLFPFASENDVEYQLKETTADQLIRKWKRIQAMLDSFWHSWRSEYLLSLRTLGSRFRQRNTSQAPPTLGDVVLVKDNLPRSKWKMGIISELKRSNDGHIRSASIRLPSQKCINRPIKLLYPLEISSTTEFNPVDPTNSKDVRDRKPKRKAAEVAIKEIRKNAAIESSTDDSE